MTAFDDATAITALGGGAHTAVCDPAWDAPRGPNGGYLAAIVLRAMAAELDDDVDPQRAPVRWPQVVQRDRPRRA